MLISQCHDLIGDGQATEVGTRRPRCKYLLLDGGEYLIVDGKIRESMTRDHIGDDRRAG